MTIKELKIQLALGSLSNGIKYKLADNTNTSKEILRILSKDKDLEVRWNVAGNPNTSKEILKILSIDEDSIVRRRTDFNQTFREYKESEKTEKNNCLRKS